MKLSEYQRSRSFFDHGQSHSDLKNKTCFSQKQFGDLDQSSYESLRENGNENLYK